MENFPHEGTPTGWYQVGWADEVLAGDVRPLHYFGTDLVMYRDENEDVHVMDAHCPHMGAHLGYGGKVRDAAIECPFHGWVWGCDGRNESIPYSDSVVKSRRVRTYPVAEYEGLIFAWYDHAGADPEWDVPAFLPESSSHYYPIRPFATKEWRNMAVAAQMIVENLVDVGHFQPMHNIPDLPVIEEFRAEPHHAYIRQQWKYGRKKSVLTPEGPVHSYLESDVWGLGIILFRFPGFYDAVQILTQTPVDDGTTDCRMAVWAPKPADETGDLPSGRAKAVIEAQLSIIDADVPIWENMVYVQKPPLVKEEARTYTDLRKWCAQFYPVNRVAADSAEVSR